MKIKIILFGAILIMFPVVGLIQTSEAQVVPAQPATTTAQESAAVFPPKTAETPARCGVYYYKFFNDCGAALTKNVYAQCFDGSQVTLGDESSCKTTVTWTQLANDACANRCETPQSLQEPTTTTAPTPTYSCNNNGICDANMGETITNCEKDCGQATTLRGTCGDKICQPTESKSSCSVDCGYPWVCGDGICGGTETDWNCPKDCSQSTATPTATIPGGNIGGEGGEISATPMPATSETPISKPTIIGTPGPTTAATSPNTKCGASTFKVFNECGAGVYKNVFAQCFDGFEVTLGEMTSCKPADLWNQYAKEACANHCSGGGSGTAALPASQSTASAPVIYNTGDDVGGGNRATPLKPLSSMPATTQKWISVCAISDNLMQQYNELIAELQRQEARSDKIKAEEITRQIVAKKQYIEAQKKACAENPQTAWQVAAPPTATENKPIAETENKPIVISMDRCNEVTQWETKIAYYKKLNGLNDIDLGKEGFSRGEVEKILQELTIGIDKVRAQCGSQEKTPAITRATAATGAKFITETVKPVVAGSGQEISSYYKSRIEKAVSARGEDKQIEELKTLRDEIDGLISNLIKSRKEMEVSELNTLVKEVKVSRGEIKADDISVKTTEKKMLVNVGDRPVSVEPTDNQVLIRDKGLEVNTNEVLIKDNVLSVGGADVKMSASEVTEKLGLMPTTIELKEENAKAVYNMKINERRKLFGFIPLNIQKAVTADAENGNTLSEHHPWYNFLTTK